MVHDEKVYVNDFTFSQSEELHDPTKSQMIVEFT